MWPALMSPATVHYPKQLFTWHVTHAGKDYYICLTDRFADEPIEKVLGLRFKVTREGPDGHVWVEYISTTLHAAFTQLSIELKDCGL